MLARRLATALIGLALLGQPVVARAQAPSPADAGKPEKLRDIRRLLDVTGAGKLGMQVLEQMVAQFRVMMPKVPDRFWSDFVREANPDELAARVVPIYDRHLTHEEIKAIIQFYETPAGRKLIGAMPMITQESMDVGKQWGEALGQKIQQRLRQQGYGK